MEEDGEFSLILHSSLWFWDWIFYSQIKLQMYQNQAPLPVREWCSDLRILKSLKQISFIKHL